MADVGGDGKCYRGWMLEIVAVAYELENEVELGYNGAAKGKDEKKVRSNEPVDLRDVRWLR